MIAGIAARQHGVVERTELLAAGFTASQVDRCVRVGLLRSIGDEALLELLHEARVQRLVTDRELRATLAAHPNRRGAKALGRLLATEGGVRTGSTSTSGRSGSQWSTTAVSSTTTRGAS